MKLEISKNDVNKLKKLNNTKLNSFLSQIDDINENKAIEFMEFLYDKANEYLKGKDYKETPESILLEKIADYIYDKTNN